MRDMRPSKLFLPVLLSIGGCSSDGNTPESAADGAASGRAGVASGGASPDAAGDGGAAGRGTGGTSSGGTSGAGANSGGSPASGGAGVGKPLSFQCSSPAPNVTAPPASWANATGNLAGMASECGNLGLVSANPCSDMVIAGVAQAGLWGTEDGGKTWSKLGTGAGSATITNRISAVVYDPDHEGTFWESGIYNGGGVYKTTDNGKTFTQLGNAHHNDSVSVDFTDPERKTLLAGPHEATSTTNLSRDGGMTWNNVGMTLPASAGYCVATLVLGAANLLVGCQNGGVFHSSNGTDWTSVGSKGVSPQPLVGSDGTIYFLGSQGGVEVSADGGQHFTETIDGGQAPGIVGPVIPAELPDGRIAILGTDHILLSADKGVTWKPIGEPLPYPGGGYNGARGPAYSARTKTFYIWRWDCGTSVLPDAIMSSGFDYTTL